MSGGVDSSVAAALLKQQGHDVIGIMLRLWSEPGTQESNRCCTPEAMAQARRVAAILDIPFYPLDARDVFHNQVVSYFVDGYAQGTTPNPCLACNKHVRWTFLLQQATNLGADHLATGHYARVKHDINNGSYELLRAVDSAKDQSYILHVLDQDRLAHALFPLGELTKSQVRQLARDFDLPVAERPDSQDLCFLANGDYHSFLKRHAPEVEQSGPIISSNGNQLGQHAGIAFYTIGQRKGLGISSSEPLYVLDKNMNTNTLVVGTGSELGKSKLIAQDVRWLSGRAPSSQFRGQVKIRYKAREAWATITEIDDQCLEILFDEPIRDITPGQAAVVYNGDVCLGGGIIHSSTG